MWEEDDEWEEETEEFYPRSEDDDSDIPVLE